MTWTNGMEQAYQQHCRVHVYDSGHIERVMDQAIEEAGELIVAIQHRRRGRAVAQDIRDEWMDLYLCMRFLMRSLGITDADCKEQLDGAVRKLTAALDTQEPA